MNDQLDSKFVIQVMDRVAPLDCELLGEDAICHFVEGGRFSSPSGGRNFDLSQPFEVLGHVVTVITLAQLAYRKFKTSRPAESPTADELTHDVDHEIAQLADHEKPVVNDDQKRTVCHLVIDCYAGS